MSICPTEVDAMLLREFATASFNNRRAETARLSCRALDKVYAEFCLRGFAGYRVIQVNGQMHIEGITHAEMQVAP